MPTYEASIDYEVATSHTLMVQLVGRDARVLDVGCATGYLGAALIDRGCTVVGVELDPTAAEAAKEVLEDVLVADLDEVDLLAAFGPETFDVVVFGDVLEHLKDPERLLAAATTLLRPGGAIIISVPNAAHADQRLLLLQGRWEYHDRGLLDRTHIRFFTRATLEELVHGAGLIISDLRRTLAPALATELAVDPGHLPPGVVDWVRAEPESDTYQFVLRAVVNDQEGVVGSLVAERAELLATVQDLTARVDRLQGEVLRNEHELAELRSTSGRLAAEVDHWQTSRAVKALQVPGRAARAVARTFR